MAIGPEGEKAGELHVVTGAFGYSGRYIAQRLLQRGCRVRTLTNSLHRENPFGSRVEARPFDFERPERLAEALSGATALYNTYWVRFNHATFRYSQAVENSRKLIAAATKAGVQRIVHLSITNPSEDSPLEYFRGKAQLERAVVESGISYAILRPTVLFGAEDILVNNIAWTLRHFPAFGVFGNGEYRLQPIYVDDLARVAVEAGARDQNEIIDAIGPETFTYRELVACIARCIQVKRPIVSVPPLIGLWLGRLIGWIMGDVLITRDEIEGLMHGLLCTTSPPAGNTRLTDWVETHAATLGHRYASELARRRDRFTAYEDL